MKRMFACSLLILAVPIIAATLQPNAKSITPFASTAYAGHTLGGGYCTCGCPGCFCDPGEDTEMCLPEAANLQGVVKETGVPVQSSNSDVPAAAFLIGTGLLIWKRIRR